MAAKDYEIILCKDGQLYINKKDGNDFRSKDSKRLSEADYAEITNWFKKYGEQKLEEAKPKFKVGDWVVSPNGVYWHIDAINNNRYEVSSTDGTRADWPLNTSLYRLWTIQDAKYGDVLACLNDAGDRDVIFIFKNINSDEGWVFCFCAIDANGCFCTNNDYVGNNNSSNIHPATKEQRDQLEKAITDAGYTFDFEKKELKKIEQKPAEWHREDEQNLNACLGYIPDEFLRRWLTDAIHTRYDKPAEWKPSDEQLNSLYDVLNPCDGFDRRNLESLYQDLKKLTE